MIHTRKMQRKMAIARDAVYRAVKKGKVKKPSSCEKCGKIGNMKAHHEDYEAPLEIIWLCHSCHMKKHGKQISVGKLVSKMAEQAYEELEKEYGIPFNR